MSDQNKGIDTRLVPAGGRDLALVGAANPFVARGIADLALACSATNCEVNRLNTLVVINRGSVWLIKEEYERAIADFSEAIQMDPRCAAAYNLRGKAWSGTNQHEKALADYNEAIRFQPNYPAFYINRGLAWREIQRYEQAFKDLTHAIQLDPANAQAYASRGETWFQNNEYEKALADFDTAIGLDPKTSAFYVSRGKVWLWQGESTKAFTDFDKAIRLDYSCDAFSYRAIAWIEKRNWDEAKWDFEYAIERGTKHATVYWTRGIEWIRERHSDDAIAYDSLSATLHYNRGRVWLEEENYDSAVKDFDEAIVLDPQFGFIDDLDGIAWGLTVMAAGYAEAKRFDEAILYQAKALEDPDYRGSRGDELRHRLELYKEKKPYRQMT